MPRSEHSAEVAALVDHLNDTMGVVGALLDSVNEDMGLAAVAIGDSPSESGQNVMAWLAQVKDEKIDELLRFLVNIQAEAQRYGEGF